MEDKMGKHKLLWIALGIATAVGLIGVGGRKLYEMGFKDERYSGASRMQTEIRNDVHNQIEDVKSHLEILSREDIEFVRLQAKEEATRNLLYRIDYYRERGFECFE